MTLASRGCAVMTGGAPVLTPVTIMLVLPGPGSDVTDETVTMFVIGSNVDGVTVKETLLPAPFAIVPRVQVTIPLL